MKISFLAADFGADKGATVATPPEPGDISKIPDYVPETFTMTPLGANPTVLSLVTITQLENTSPVKETHQLPNA